MLALSQAQTLLALLYSSALSAMKRCYAQWSVVSFNSLQSRQSLTDTLTDQPDKGNYSTETHFR